jgi:hypothetical protein
MTYSYSKEEFLRDYEEWEALPITGDDATQATRCLFAEKYPRPDEYAYRYDRFRCVITAVHRDLPMLIQDGIAPKLSRRGNTKAALVPARLFVALHEWYGSLPASALRDVPAPDWLEVLRRFDRLSPPDK